MINGCEKSIILSGQQINGCIITNKNIKALSLGMKSYLSLIVKKKRTLVDLIFVHNYPDGDVLSLQIIFHNNNNGIILMVMFSLRRKLSSSLSYSEEDCFVLGWKPSFTF